MTNIIKEENDLLNLGIANTLTEDEIEQYDYLLFKNNFSKVVRILNTNQIVHQEHADLLSYKIDPSINFVVDFGDYVIHDNDGEVYSLARGIYDFAFESCILLLDKVANAWKTLNPTERYILKSLEFDERSKTDEDLQEIFLISKNRYYRYKKSAYIKIGLYLKLNSDNLKYEKQFPNVIERTEYIYPWKNNQ